MAATQGCARTRGEIRRTPAFATWFAFGDSAVPQGGGHEAWPIGIELEGRGVAEKLFRPRDSRRAGILGCFALYCGESSEMDRGAGEARTEPRKKTGATCSGTPTEQLEVGP